MSARRLRSGALLGCALALLASCTGSGPQREVLAPRPAPQAERAEECFQRGLELASSERPEEALLAFQRCAQLDPRRYDAHYRAGRCYYLLGRYELEITEYALAHAVNPRYPPAWRALGDACLARDDLQGARKAYQRYLEVAPADPRVLYSLGLVEADLGRPDQARALWQRVAGARSRGLRELARERLAESSLGG